jgi:hypothetical protein
MLGLAQVKRKSPAEVFFDKKREEIIDLSVSLITKIDNWFAKS